MASPARLRRPALIVAAPAVALGACSWGRCPRRGTTPHGFPRLPPVAKLVPSCGVLWGVATSPASPETVAELDRLVGRPFDLVYDYDDIVSDIPTPTELEEIHQGRILHIAVASRIYGEPQTAVTYADIAAGRYDAQLKQQAAGIASLDVPVFVTFEQEANQHSKLGPRGTAAQFRSAWRHVHDVYVSNGATNAVWVWVMTGAAENLHRAGELWPGNDDVDWISWNVYNQSGCETGTIDPALYESFETGFTPFYHWLHARGPALGIDPDKPVMVSETGSVLYAGDAEKTAAWYADIPSVLSKYPQVKAVQLWDSLTSPACDYRFQRDSTVVSGVSSAGLSPVVVGTANRP